MCKFAYKSLRSICSGPSTSFTYFHHCANSPTPTLTSTPTVPPTLPISSYTKPDSLSQACGQTWGNLHRGGTWGWDGGGSVHTPCPWAAWGGRGTQLAGWRVCSRGQAGSGGPCQAVRGNRGWARLWHGACDRSGAFHEPQSLEEQKFSSEQRLIPPIIHTHSSAVLE